MNWLVKTLSSSIGKKLMMALTGLSFIGFLAGHLIGNLTIYGGQEFFMSYVEHLHAMGVLIHVAEVVLLTCAIIHVLTGLILFYQNLKARPNRYVVNKNAGGRTIGSATMPYTGIILLAFIIFHLMSFHFVDHVNQTTFQIVSNAFAIPAIVIVYIIAMIVAAIHVSHGFWSAFQTIGFNHPKYMPAIKLLGLIFSIVVGIGFGFIPVYVSFIA